MRIYKNVIDIINLCFRPFSIFSPIPFFCLALYLISFKYYEITVNNLFLLYFGIIVSLISSAASNFWNHTNDIEEDIKNDKQTLLTQGIITKSEAIFISIFLYIISILLTLYISYIFERPIYLFFIIWVIITWWYSDNIFMRKIIRIRLKTHYIGELITYVIAYPAYTMSIWLIFSDSLKTGCVLSLIFLCFGLAGVLLKDLKDIKGDREAGLKTLGVVFSPMTLVKISCMLLVVYFCIIILSANLRIFNSTTIIVILPFIYLIKNTVLYFYRKNWIIEGGDYKNIKAMILSIYSSILIIGISNFC